MASAGDILQVTLTRLGLVKVLVPRDGHCLLHAISEVLKCEKQMVTPEKLLALIESELLGNVEFYKDFLAVSNSNTTGPEMARRKIEFGLLAYRNKQYKNEVVDLVVPALCNALHITIVILYRSDEGEYKTLLNTPVRIKEDIPCSEAIHILRTDGLEYTHYDGLVRKSSRQKPNVLPKRYLLNPVSRDGLADNPQVAVNYGQHVVLPNDISYDPVETCSSAIHVEQDMDTFIPALRNALHINVVILNRSNEGDYKTLPNTPIRVKEDILGCEAIHILRSDGSEYTHNDGLIQKNSGQKPHVPPKSYIVNPISRGTENSEKSQPLKTVDGYPLPTDGCQCPVTRYYQDLYVNAAAPKDEEKIKKVILTSNPTSEYAILESIAFFWSFLDVVHMQHSLPRHFQRSVKTFIEEHTLAGLKLLSLDALPFWNCRNATFSQNWTMSTVNEIRQKLGKSIKPNRDYFCVVSGALSLCVRENYFLRLKEILVLPTKIYENGKSFYPLVEIYPYISQKVKMWGVHVLNPACLIKVFEALIISEETKLQNKTELTTTTLAKKVPAHKILGKKVPTSRLDFVTFCLGTADCLVARDIIQILSKFSVALPLIMNDIWKEQHLIMLPLLRDILIRWESQPGNIVENFLFRSPFKMVLAARIGENGRNVPGKSTILNQVLQPKYYFASFDEPGGINGKPISLDGTVEFTWLTRETSSDSLWENVLKQMYSEGVGEVILLANLHGDIMNYLHYLKFFQLLSCSYLIFVMQSVTTEGPEIKAFRDALPCDHNMPNYLFVDKRSGYNDDSDDEDENIISTSMLAGDRTSTKLCSAMEKAIRGTNGKKECNIEDIANVHDLYFTTGIYTNESCDFMNLVKCTTCQKVKQILQLNKDHSGKLIVDKWKQNKEFVPFLTKLMKIFLLPSSEMKVAVTHIENELSHLSCMESANARKDFMKYERYVREAFLDSKKLDAEKKVDLEKRNVALELAEQANLGMEHFIRELCQLYQIESGSLQFKDLPKHCAQLLLNGCAIELMNGDTGNLPEEWISAICKSVHEHHLVRRNEELKVFVVSIIGLQSSGKSTLLNALFGCKFAVSVGRCTRGLFMRLIFLELGMRDLFRFDAFLVIDTEGLGSIEKANDPNAEKRDRQMATFAMGISDLTIINVMGEAVAEMKDILQIAIIAMARLGKLSDMTSDILLVQHVQTRDEAKLATGEKAFCDALKYVFDALKGKHCDFGIQDMQCLQNLFSTIQSDSFFKRIRPLNDGASCNARPSALYHEDVVDLYNTILVNAKNSKEHQSLRKWCHIACCYWKVAELEDFASRFKNIKEMIDFIDREKRIADVKESIDLMFRTHCEALTLEMNKRKSSHSFQKDIFDLEVQKHLVVFPQLCGNGDHLTQTMCDSCKKTAILIENLYSDMKAEPHEKETKIKIESHWKSVCDMTKILLSQVAEKLKMKEDVQKNVSAAVLDALKMTLQNRDKSGLQLNDIELNLQSRKLWDEISSQMHSKWPVKQPFHRTFLTDLLKVYANVGSLGTFQQMFTKGVTKEKLAKEGAVFKKQMWKLNEKLPHRQLTETTRVLEKAANSLYKSSKATQYDSGLMSRIRSNISDTISELEKEFAIMFVPEYKWKLHVYALQVFYKFAAEKQTEWERNNNPHIILEMEKETILKDINSRLRYGFCAASDGLKAGQLLSIANEKRAKKHVENWLEEKAASQIWILNSATVRLTFFEELVTEVRKGKKENAITFFLDPKNTIENWFVSRVDEYAPEDAESQYKSALKEGLGLDLNAIETNSVSDVEIYIKNYGEDPMFSTDPTKYTKEDIASFRECAIRELKSIASKVPSEFVLPSKRPNINNNTNRIMGRLGCPEACNFCGALCWCPRGHDASVNGRQVSEHVTCHQPAGLNAMSIRTTHELDATPCYKYTDATLLFYDKFRETGIVWLKVKNEEYPNWKFCRYDERTNFEELMRWFFFQLHEDIAVQKQLIPCTVAMLEEHNCVGVDVDAVVKCLQKELYPLNCN